MARRRFPAWFRTVGLAVVFLWAIVTAYYWMGARGVSAYGATTSFDRQHDFALFGVDDTRALRVDRWGVALVLYKRGTFPFCPLCGVNQSAGMVMPGARYAKGDWIYTDTPGASKEAVNVKSGETVDLPGGQGEPLAQPPPDFVARGLDFAPENVLDGDKVAARFARLSTINEGCVTFNLAFILVFGLLLLVGIPLALRRPKAG